MPPPYILTVGDQILYEQAALMSRAAFGKLHQGFVFDRFKLLRDGRLSLRDTIREWEREQEPPRACGFCGSTEEITTGHLIPKSRGGSDSPDNHVLTCQQCITARGEKGIFEWLGLLKKDSLHPLVAGRYLLQLLEAHTAAGTLDVPTEEISGYCHICPLPGVCEEWGSEGRLTCFCLESVLPFSGQEDGKHTREC